MSQRKTNFCKMLNFSAQKSILLVLILSCSYLSFGQNIIPNDSIQTKEIIDSLIIDRNFYNWSARIYGNIKAQRFKIFDDNDHVKFTPNNLYGIGFGIANKKLILDIGYNLKSKRKEETDRFDLKASVFLKENVFDFYVQVYEGFNVRNSIDKNSEFRKDIKSIAVGIDYLFLFNGDKFSTRLLRTGLSDLKENIYSFGAGSFLLYNKISGDRSLISEDYHSYFNEEARITNFSDFAIGVKGGFISVINLPSDFYFGFTANLGVGIAFKNTKAENLAANTSTSGIYKIKASVLAGYRWNRFYTNFSVSGNNYRTSLGHGNKGALSLIRSKLVLGYRIKRKKTNNSLPIDP